MSYDLYFKSRDGARNILYDNFRAYFSDRMNYELSGYQAWYRNDDTGVYFCFDYGAFDSDELDLDPALLPMRFTLNYFRPHIFALEAGPELEAFIKHFDLMVSDPQAEGMGDGDYSSTGFLAGWNNGNEAAVNSILQSDDNESPPETLETDKIDQAWHWNKQRRELQKTVGPSVQVPRIIFIKTPDGLETGIQWLDGLPIALPRVDVVLAYRDRLAQRSYLIKKSNLAILNYEEVVNHLADFEEHDRDGVVPYHLLDYKRTPSALANFIRKHEAIEGQPRDHIVPPDQVLNLELVSKLA